MCAPAEPQPPPPCFLLLLLQSRSVRAESNFTPLEVILNTHTKYPACHTIFMMSHMVGEGKYKLF